MSRKKRTYESLFQMGYTKAEIHHALHALMLAKIAFDKKPFAKKVFIQNIQLFRFCPISGKALTLLKTMFSKKPKNPV